MFNLQEALDAIKGKEEFAIKETDNFFSFDYNVIFSNSFSVDEKEIELLMREKNISYDEAKKLCEKYSLIRRQFRGITFSKEGDLLSLPLEKFFNINQTNETQFDKIKHLNGKIYEKMDGTMIHFFLYKEILFAATRSSCETDHAKLVIKLVDKDEELKNKIIQEIKNGCTPIFEFISPLNKIVVNYDKTQLIYLVSRDRNNGSYIINDNFSNKAKTYEFDFCDIKNHLDIENFEGYVCYLENGMIVKARQNGI